MGFKVRRFPADWNRYGKRAGYVRNQEMAEYASHCILFWDGASKGTKIMSELSSKYGLIGTVIRYAGNKTTPPL